MVIIIEHVRCNLTSGALTAKNTSSDANGPQKACIATWIVGSMRLLVERFKNCDRFSTVIIEKIGA
jgi:hypothetical protein